MKRFILLIAAIFLFTVPLRAEGDKIHVYLKSKVSANAEGDDFKFKCDFLRLSIQGTFADNFSYIFRQRLNKSVSDGDFLSATDYLYINWKKNNWELGGGKHYIVCGGYDYNSSTYDLYIRPEYFNGLGGMYNYVIDAAYHFGNERLCLELSNSLYSTKASNLLGYSINLSGRQGFWGHNYSANLFEREKGKYNQFICLGNQFYFGPATLNLDFDHRFDVSKPEFFKNFSLVTKLKVHAKEWIDVYGKATWDYKNDMEDPILPDNTNIWKAGLGVELYPVKTYRNLRLHCFYYNVNGEKNCCSVGFAWMLSILKK